VTQVSAAVIDTITRFRADVDRLIAEVGQRLVGQREALDGVVTALLAGGHALLEGVPGLGKTLLVRTLADALDLAFSRIQFTPDLMPSDVTGTHILVDSDGGGRRLEFQRGAIFANLVLADEINRATPKTQSALLEAMQEQTVTVGRTTHPLPLPFFVLATQNPIEMEGTYPLPEAQLDRFFFKIRVPYPSDEQLHAILERTTGSEDAPVRPVLTGARLIELRAVVRQVPIARPIQDYAVRLVQATHPGADALPEVARTVRFGSSPRGAQALVLAAKATALLDGRPNAASADVRAVASAALRHRLVLGYEAVADGVSADEVVDEILKAVPEPSTGLRGAP
jgi:MoxR-like ATPase